MDIPRQATLAESERQLDWLPCCARLCSASKTWCLAAKGIRRRTHCRVSCSSPTQPTAGVEHCGTMLVGVRAGQCWSDGVISEGGLAKTMSASVPGGWSEVEFINVNLQKISKFLPNPTQACERKNCPVNSTRGTT